MSAGARQIKQPANRTQQVICRNILLEVAAVEQRLL